MKRLALAVLVVATAAGCSLKPQRKEVKAEAAYTFPHGPHLDGDVACTNCHAGVVASTELVNGERHVRMPAQPYKNPICSDCHDKETNEELPVRSPTWRIRVDHSAHLARGMACRTCHVQLPEQGDRRAPVPTMAACTSCHEHQSDFAAAKCTPCHVDLKGYFPQTAFSHQGDWMKVHGANARPSAQSCAACHDQTSCAECHAAQTTATRPSVVFPEDVGRAFIHRGDYISRHVVDARASPASCRTCHGSSFCNACHVEQGVTSKAINVRDPHPRGWSTDKGTSHFHGDAARRDILSCAGCHDNGAASTCVSCHQMGGVGGNPHPLTFLKQFDGSDRKNNGMCKACHVN